MSQAEELLNSTTTLVSAHEHPVNDTDQYYVIDPATRTITNVSGKNVLIQYDHNSERFTFEIPRYVDGHDMSLCNATKVHYINIEVVEQDPNVIGTIKPKTKPGVYEVDDVKVSPDDEDKVLCTWLISRNATQLAGTLSFLIQYACADDNNNLTYEWHTDIYTDVLVNTGMNNGAAVLANAADIIEQWKNELFAEVDEWKAGVLTKVEADVQEIASGFQDGKDGYTPVKGVDYWTEEDKTEICNTVAPKHTTVTLTSAGWTDSAQTVNVIGVTADTAKTIVIVSPEPSAENYAVYNDNAIRCVSQGDNTLTFQCESPPPVDVIVNVAIYYTSTAVEEGV